MTSKFEELRERALDELSDDYPHGDVPLHIFAEVFAKILITESITGLENNYPPDDCLPVDEVSGFLKQHFGVTS